MTREMYRDARVVSNKSVNNHIIGNIIERYKDSNDNDSYFEDSLDASSVLRTAEDGELIYGTRVSEKDDGWYLEFQDGKLDGPYQQIEYDANNLYCTIIYGLAYQYELSGLLNSAISEFGYFAYLKQFVSQHKDDYEKYKKARHVDNRYGLISKYQRAALFELDYRHSYTASQQAVRRDVNQESLDCAYLGKAA